jgi:crossover junction endodeoxyribonuclease RuvC
MRFVGIDPSTKTGFVALDESDEVLREKELTGIGDKDPKRMVTLIHDIVSHIQPGDVICIEGFPYDTQRAMFAGGLHHGIRNELYKRKIKYFEVAPNAVKKFVGVTGWTGEPGKKKRLKGPEKKRAVMDAIKEHYGVIYSNDNIADAYILAQIAKAIMLAKHSHQAAFIRLEDYQAEVLINMFKPPEDPKPKKKKKVAK